MKKITKLCVTILALGIASPLLASNQATPVEASSHVNVHTKKVAVNHFNQVNAKLKAASLHIKTGKKFQAEIKYTKKNPISVQNSKDKLLITEKKVKTKKIYYSPKIYLTVPGKSDLTKLVVTGQAGTIDINNLTIPNATVALKAGIVRAANATLANFNVNLWSGNLAIKNCRQALTAQLKAGSAEITDSTLTGDSSLNVMNGGIFINNVTNASYNAAVTTGLLKYQGQKLNNSLVQNLPGVPVWTLNVITGKIVIAQ
ncbi:DUF4097 family beta strand repeat-containing protein [Lactobacillus sp. ESL0731]|uniref:DUF4097 family beta strand repeat-containing protein n=1 Tax=unclassified Lactobacillus TaxID=2620435 RepID=UPI0023F70446|nr:MULTISPECIES: DUF4097 family beta strand repeat-containing protein [unclassified Lactobacillus]WEV50993.1 DUF4097 family beta strand repeat-containing protein [Lactobacillus sp. ESL0700]WEV62124.1 DUF4097 family beta strand repeat-containing protein [Lactobacillus sp. ESL0731]